MKTALHFLVTLLSAGAAFSAAALDTNRIAQITGLPGTWNAAEEVFKRRLDLWQQVRFA